MRILVGILFLAFSAYTAWVAWTFGYTSVFTETLRSQPSTQALVDLFLAAGMLMVIMIVDHLKQGRSLAKLIPYLLLTLVFASVGPLLYFFVYPDLLLLHNSKTKSNPETISR